jgi:hypothetical protein
MELAVGGVDGKEKTNFKIKSLVVIPSDTNIISRKCLVEHKG